MKPILLISLLFCLLAACSAPSSESQTRPDQAMMAGGTLVIAGPSRINHFNMAVQSGLASSVPATQIFASPLRYDADWNPQPYLAERWEVAEDGLSLTLYLVQNAVFHDGEPITSADVKFSLETVKQYHPFQSMFAPVAAVETPDDHTVIIRLVQPHPAILLAMSPPFLPILPAHIYNDGQDLRTHPRNTQNVIGSGPFRLVDFDPAGSTVLERFDDYFIEGRPLLDRIILNINPDLNSLALEIENGSVDMLPLFSDSLLLERLQQADNITVTQQGHIGIGAINWLAFNTQHAILSNVEVRRAIAYAIDRDFITQSLHGGYSQPVIGPIVPESPFASPTIEHYDVDVDKANALLDAAGYSRNADGIRFSLTIDYIPGVPQQQKNVAEYLKSQLQTVGIELTLRASPDIVSWIDRVGNHNFDLTMDIVNNWGDPVIGVHRTYLSSNIRQGVPWSNTQSYVNPRVDELLNLAAQELDSAARTALYAEFQQIVADDVPVYWLNTLPFHTVTRTRVNNVPTSIWGVVSPMDEVWVAQP